PCPSSTLTAGYTYTTPPPPTITSVSPNTGTVSGGTSISINGANFQYGATVTIGGRPATVQTWTGSYIYATTPTGQSTGSFDVVVTNPDNQSVTLAGGYAYN
ncbi:MAG: cell shape-determining protein, partial [Acidobacteria bacterium]